MRVRYVGPVEELEVQPVGRDSVFVKRLDYVDLPSDVVGHRPSGKPGDVDEETGESRFDLGDGLLAQGEYVDGEFQPLWELESVKKAQRTRAENAATSGEEE